MEDDVATRRYRCARARLDRAGQGAHRDIVAHQQTTKSQPVPNHIPDQSDRSCGRSNRIDSRVYDMGGHPKRQIRKRPECGKIGGPEGFAVGLDDGKRAVAVRRGTAMPGNMLEHRQNPAGQEAVGHRACQQSDLLRGFPISPVANHQIGAGDGKIEHRQTIDGNPKSAEIIGDQPCAEPGGCLGPRVRQ